jgi:hypothetical protein
MRSPLRGTPSPSSSMKAFDAVAWCLDVQKVRLSAVKALPLCHGVAPCQIARVEEAWGNPSMGWQQSQLWCSNRVQSSGRARQWNTTATANRVAQQWTIGATDGMAATKHSNRMVLQLNCRPSCFNIEVPNQQKAQQHITAFLNKIEQQYSGATVGCGSSNGGAAEWPAAAE